MRRWPSGRRQQSPKLPEFISHVSSNLSLRAINLRESFNGRKAVSKTVNEGSIPSSRAKKRNDIMKKIVNYCKACYEELVYKTTWPTRKQLTHSAMVVLSASLVIAVVVFCMDSLFKFVMSSIYPN